MRFIDPDGLTVGDVVAGNIIGAITNIIPLTTTWRNVYTPADATDYNGALQATDNAALSVFLGMVSGGGAATGIGEPGMLAGAGASATGVGAAVGCTTCSRKCSAGNSRNGDSGSRRVIGVNATLNASARYNYGSGGGHGNSSDSENAQKIDKLLPRGNVDRNAPEHKKAGLRTDRHKTLSP